MDDRTASHHIKLRSERRYLAIVYGAPIFLALLTVTCWSLPVVKVYGEWIANVNGISVFLIATMAGVFSSGIEVPVRKRVLRGIGDGIFGVVVFGMSLFVIGMSFGMLGVSRWMAQ